MNEEAVQALNQICQKSVVELTDYDQRFLRARRTYLSADMKEKFAEVLGEKKTEPSYHELVEQAKALGLKTTGVKKAELLRMVAEVLQ